MKSLDEELKAAAARDELRLHTPGHKGRLCSLDLTELTDESFPADSVRNAEARIAEYYGVRHARMLCGGSSQGVKSAVFYGNTNGIADVNSHRSVFDGFVLAGKRCATVGRRGDVRPITVKDIAAALTPDIGAVLVTSPTYYGFAADVDAIAEYCRAHGLLFIIDGAHGAHFGACPLLPARFSDRCDVCNMSTHKTLSALTQTAVLLDNLSDDDGKRLSDAADVMGTTSPSYLLYSSIDSAVRELASAQERYSALYPKLAELATRFPFLQNDDFTRLVLDCNALGADAQRLNMALARRGVYSELADKRYIVFLFTAADEPSAVDALADALVGATQELL